MECDLVRYYENNFDTLGLWYIDKVFYGFTLERERGVCVPDGNYILKLRHSPKFSPIYGTEMLWITGNGQDERYCLVHKVNYYKNTDGCIGVGENIDLHYQAQNFDYLAESGLCYDRIFPLISDAVKQGEVKLNISYLWGNK